MLHLSHFVYRFTKLNHSLIHSVAVLCPCHYGTFHRALAMYRRASVSGHMQKTPAFYQAPTCRWWKHFWAFFANLREATISFIMCVCLSVRPSSRYTWAPPGRIFIKFDIWELSINLSRKFKFRQYIVGITGTVHEDQFIFLIISCSVILITKNVSDKSCRENQNTHFRLLNTRHPDVY